MNYLRSLTVFALILVLFAACSDNNRKTNKPNPVLDPQLVPPGGITVDINDETLSVKWEAAKDALSYKINVSVSIEDEKFEKADSTEGTSYEFKFEDPMKGKSHCINYRLLLSSVYAGGKESDVMEATGKKCVDYFDGPAPQNTLHSFSPEQMQKCLKGDDSSLVFSNGKKKSLFVKLSDAEKIPTEEFLAMKDIDGYKLIKNSRNENDGAYFIYENTSDSSDGILFLGNIKDKELSQIHGTIEPLNDSDEVGEMCVY